MNKVTELNKSEISAVSGGIGLAAIGAIGTGLLAAGKFAVAHYLISTGVVGMMVGAYYYLFGSSKKAANVPNVPNVPNAPIEQPKVVQKVEQRSIKTDTGASSNTNPNVVEDDSSWL